MHDSCPLGSCRAAQGIFGNRKAIAMAKFLLLILILFLVFWFVFRQRNNPGDQRAPSATENPTENIVVCAHCHLRIPESESLYSEGHHYCCDEHRQLGAT